MNSSNLVMGWLLAVVLFIAVAAMLSVPRNCEARGCFGGPCLTSDACVAGCACIAGRCS